MEIIREREREKEQAKAQRVSSTAVVGAESGVCAPDTAVEAPTVSSHAKKCHHSILP